MNKKTVMCAFCGFIFSISGASAQIDDLLGEDIPMQKTNEKSSDGTQATGYINDYIGELDKQQEAMEAARKMLDNRPKIVELRDSQMRTMNDNKKARDAIRNRFLAIEQSKLSEKERAEKIISELQPAPLGLYWGASMQQTKDIGFSLIAAVRKGYQNVYQVKNPQKKDSFFNDVTVIFGAVDKIWCIFAQSQAIEDDNKASETMRIYKKYRNALKEKYGDAEEHFIPYTYMQEMVEGEGKDAVVKKIEKTNPMEGENFLAELKEGKAILYSTFNNGKIGVTLSVFVDENNKGHLTIDYKNFTFMQKEKDTIIEEL